MEQSWKRRTDARTEEKRIHLPYKIHKGMHETRQERTEARPSIRSEDKGGTQHNLPNRRKARNTESEEGHAEDKAGRQRYSGP